MTFIWPPMLLTVLLVPIGIGLYVALDRRRRSRLSSRGGIGLAQGVTRRPTGVLGRVPSILAVAGLALMAVAMARPQAVISLPRVEGTVILAFDVSASMGAKDMTPTRIEAARAAAKDFVARQPSGITIGVVAFSDSGISAQAPTADQGEVVAAIDRLAPQRGTSVALGIAASLKAIAAAEAGPFANDYYSNSTPAPDATPTPTPTPVPAGTHSPAVIVLLSDGENNESPDPLAAAQTAADQGVRIYTVGIGSAAGTTVDLNGFQVHTALDEATLQRISQISGGTYYNATDAQQLRSIYDNLDTQLVITPQLTEITALVAGLGLLALLAGAVSSLLWLGRMP